MFKKTILALALLATPAFAQVPAPVSVTGANHLKITVRAQSPVSADVDLQIVCLFKHSDKDRYIEAMDEFNTKLGKLLSNVRSRGEFTGELGETFLFTTPKNSIKPHRVLLIGLGDESALNVDILRVVGRVALREAVRLQAKTVAFAPTIRDQGNDKVNVGDGDRLVAENVVLAYDTEKRLQKQGLAPVFDIQEWTMEAGLKFFQDASVKVTAGVKSASAEATKRSSAPYSK